MLTGVVVGHQDLGETDRIVRFLTVERGRVDLIARGARSSRRRFAGLLDLGTQVHVQPRRSRGSLATLDRLDLLTAVDRARRDLDRIAYLAYGCELCSSLAGRDLPAPRLTKLLVVWLEVLEGDLAPRVASRLALEAKALAFAGLLPDLRICASCGERLDERVVFAEDRGPMHARCGTGRSVEEGRLAELHRLLHTPLAQTVTMVSSGGWLLSDRVQAHLGRALRSRHLLEDLGRM